MNFGIISSASVLLPVLSGFYAYSRTKRYRALLFFFCFTLFVEIIANSLALNHHTNNLWVYNIYTLVEGLFWILLIASWLSREYYFVPRALAVVYAFGWIYSSLLSKTITDYDTVSSVTECALLIPLSAFFLYQLSRDAAAPVLELPAFWFITGVLFYFASTAVINFTASYMFDGKALMNSTWYIHDFFNIITNFIFAKAFLCTLRKLR